MNISEMFWKASVEEIKKGYLYDNSSDSFCCLICGESYEKGIIYKSEDKFMEAEKAIQYHIKNKHSSSFEFLLNIDKKYTGLTDHQKELLKMFYSGLTDKEIVEKSNASSTSTIRNQRFIFREKEKQAKVLLAIMELLNEKKNSEKSSEGEKLVTIHRGATMVDERYAITETEKENVLKAYFTNDEGLKLKSFSSKEKKKIIILQHIMTQFESSRKYTEKEMNSILSSIYEDYATLRRYLIEYGFMERTSDCSEYWVKE